MRRKIKDGSESRPLLLICYFDMLFYIVNSYRCFIEISHRDFILLFLYCVSHRHCVLLFRIAFENKLFGLSRFGVLDGDRLCRRLFAPVAHDQKLAAQEVDDKA